MLPSCTTCVPSCSLFPRSAGGKVMLPPLTSGSSHDCAMMNNNLLQGWKQGAPMHPPCSYHREDCVCPSSSSGRPPMLRNKPARNCFSGHDRLDTHSTTSRVTASRQPPIPLPTSPHDRKTIPHPTAIPAAISPPIEVTSQQAASKADLTSSVRTFRFKNTSMHGQSTNRRGTKSPSRRSSPSDTDGSLKEINVTRRARRQIYLKPDVEGSPFRLLMYVDCRSVESPRQMDET